MARALISLDLDGTLLKHGVFLPEAPRFLELLRAAGHLLTVNTGRLPAGFALEAARRINDESLHIFSDGALLADPGGRIWQRRTISPDAVTKILDIIAENNIMVEFHTALGIRYHLNKNSPKDRNEHVASTGTPSFSIDLAAIRGLPLVGSWLLGVPDDLLGHLRKRLVEAGVRIELYGPKESGWIVGIKPARHHKGTGLLELAERYGISHENTVMLGDGLNDLGGFKAAGMGIAVGNAPDLVQQATDHVVAPADEGGLLEAVELILKTYGRT